MSIRERIVGSAEAAGSKLGGSVGTVRDRIDEVALPWVPKREGVANPREYALIVGSVTLLVSFGVVMVYSASSARTGLQLPIRTFLIGLLLGVPACVLASRLDLDRIRALAPVILMGAGVLLLLVPLIGFSVNGAKRWLGVGLFSFQPSELAKVAIVVFLSSRLLSARSSLQSISGTLRITMWPVLAIVALIATEPDMGTAIVCVGTTFLMYILAGTPARVLGPIILGLGSIGATLALSSTYQRARLTTFLDPGANPTGAGFQSLQGQIAIGSGGITGVGPGQSVQKIFYLPEAQTDFILAVIGEELGLIALLGLLACFGVIMVCGFRVAAKATHPFAKLLAAGTTALVTTQAMLNMCVVLGIAPLTGVPLPFISYGPTNLVVLLAAVGLLLNVAADGGVRLRAIDGEGERNESADRSRWDSRPRSASAQRRG